MSSPTVFESLRKDPVVSILSILMALLVIGIIMIYSSSAFYAEQVWGSPYYFFKRHLIHVALSLVALRIGMRIPYTRYKQWIPLLMGFTFLLLLLVLIPGIGTKAGNARRWIRFLEVGFQPSELLKFTMIIWAASFLNRKKAVLSYFSQGLFPALLVMGTYSFLLLLQPDFGTAVLINMTLFMMFFAGGGKPVHMLGSLIGMAGIGTALIANKAYRMRRITGFLDPWADPLDSGFQLIQSFIAFGTGGLFGKNLGNSTQKLFFLPEGHTDFIFSILAEETGFFGVAVVLTLLLLLLRKGIEVSVNCPDDFGRNIAFGITILIVFQSLLHIGVVMGLLPTKGIPLPFISYGGSSLLLSTFLVGVLVNIAKAGTVINQSQPKSNRY